METNFKPLPEQISEKMIAAIKSGKSIFQKPVNETGTSQFVQPFNPSTGYNYKGPTALLLMMKNRPDPRWMTTDQANYNKTAVLKDSIGTLTNRFSKTEKVPVLMENGQPELKENGFPKMQTIRHDKAKPLEEWLFNGAQLRNITEYKPEPQKLSPIERAAKIIENSNAVIDRAAAPGYDAKADVIEMPLKEEFKTPQLYYAAAIQQIAAWSDHEGRLELPVREDAAQDMDIKKELRANIAAIMITTELNLPYDIGEKVGYLNAFAVVMKDSPNELFRAAADAQKMTDYVLKFERSIAIKQTAEISKPAVVKLEAGDVINYNDTQIKVAKVSGKTNQTFKLEDLGDGNKFTMKTGDALYLKLLDAKKFSQEQVSREQNFEQKHRQEEGIDREQEQGVDEEQDYSMSR